MGGTRYQSPEDYEARSGKSFFPHALCDLQPRLPADTPHFDVLEAAGFKGWFDRSNDLAFRKIIDIVFIASLGPPGGGRQDMTARFVRPFNVVGADSA